MINVIKQGVAGIIQFLRPREYVVKETAGRDGVDGRVVSYCDEHCHIAEQYRMVRTNLAYLSPDKPIKTILITSAQAREGKSVTAANLAMALSQDKTKKILLVDADFRRAAIHAIFSIKRNPGFSDIITGDATVESFAAAPVVDNLYIIPTGSSDSHPSELLISTRIKSIMDEFKRRFDYIIFDTPPALNFTSASELGSLCDAVILVVKAGVTQKGVLREAFISLGDAGAKPKATIITNTTHQLSYYYYYRS